MLTMTKLKYANTIYVLLITKPITFLFDYTCDTHICSRELKDAINVDKDGIFVNSCDPQIIGLIWRMFSTTT